MPTNRKESGKKPDWKTSPRVTFFFAPPKIKKLKTLAKAAGVTVSLYLDQLVSAHLKKAA